MAQAKGKTTAKPAVKAQVEPVENIDQATEVAFEGYKEPVDKKKKTKSEEIGFTRPDDWEIKDRHYYLITRKQPIVMTLPSRHTESRPLLWFDDEKGYERELRYATNQKSVFVDEQKGHVTLEHIIMRDGTLFVPKNKQALQLLLSVYHPLKGVLYEEVDNVQDADDDLDDYTLEHEATTLAFEMDIDAAEALLRVEYGSRVNSLSSKELKRDLILFAKRNPRVFIQLANDENIQVRNIGIKAVERGILELGDNQRAFYWKATGRKIMAVPFGENPYSALAAFFKTDEGVEVFQAIEKRLK